MAYFHYRCGERITLQNDNCTAIRNDNDFDHGLVITAEPLVNDTLFEIRIDRKVNSWSGSLEIGVTETDPLHFEFPACASRLQNGTWIMAGNSVLKDGALLMERYGMDLDRLNQEDRVGIMRTSEGDLIFYINGESQGVAAENLPQVVFGVVDLYGKCVQVTITNPALREHNNDDCLSGSSVLAIDNDILNVTLGADLSELSLSSSNSLDIRMDMNVSLNLPEEPTRFDKLKFHERCGSLVKLSNGQRTAERRRPLDEFNNGVVMTHRNLRDSELFEIRIDRLVDKWSGSIEMGVTTHNPNTLVFPATMTNMRSGTIMMSGCGILTNGKGTRREYGDFNLDELNEGDRVGMMRKPNGDLHYFINGSDQGVAAQRVPTGTWGVIDLYGMTIKVSIVERDEREEHNLNMRRSTRIEEQLYPAVETQPVSDYYDRLTFHANCGAHAQVINNGRTALRPNAADDFNNGVVLTSRPLKLGELFEVRLERVVTKWAGSIEIGVTTHSPTDLEFPFTMTNVRSGTWMMTGSGIMHNGTTVLEQYGVNLDRLQVGDRVGVVRKESGLLHFFVNGVDQGTAATNVAEKVYGVIDLYGQAVEAAIVDMFDYNSPDTMHSSLSNTTLYSDLRFHHVHGKNARITNNGQTALRPRPLAEFNDAIVFSNRPLRDGELFEVSLENMVDRWSGSIEIGVTAARPDDLELPSTATDLAHDTWMLSGSSVMENGVTIKNNYACDLDTLGAGIRIGLVRSSEKTLEFYKDGVPQGVACVVTHSNIYAVVDLYGQCAQVSIPCISPIAPLASVAVDSCPRSDTSVSLQATSVVQPIVEADLHRFHECHGKGLTLSEGGRVAVRGRELRNCIAFSATSLVQDELYEFTILSLAIQFCGSLAVGITALEPNTSTTSLSSDCCYITGNELRLKNKVLHHFTPNLSWLRVGDRVGLVRIHDGTVKIHINNDELHFYFPNMGDTVYAIIELKGSCTAVAVTSRKVPVSPLTVVRLQDSLELALEPDRIKSDPLIEAQKEVVALNETVVQYEFHENHGRNIELLADRNIARRVASYNQGLVIVQPALQPGQMVKVLLEQLDMKWSSSLMIGVISGSPDRINLPVSGLAIKNSCCIIASDWISINGVKSKSNFNKLSCLTAGTYVGLMLTEASQLQLYIDGVAEESIHFEMPSGQSCYAVFDLYGQCQQIKIINEVEEEPSRSSIIDFEKADLESCEKERSETSLSLPLVPTNPSPSNQKHNTPTPPNKPCVYQQDCERYKKMLLLPDEFFVSEESMCFCNNCSKSSFETIKEECLKGWVKFSLRNLHNLQTEKWHTAFYGTKLGFVRNILDRGQPFTKGQEQFGNLVCKKGDDLQIVLNPSLQNCTMDYFKMEESKEICAAFQLFVKPGAYSVARDCPEWSTKETGALVLHALLLRIK
ncbi:hypothetical protein RN001_008274 [Aquatica leii]|uniref:NHR domain-containing protein n=1 Tax=Aquatica leii TaxID=1421715 RepID=A0AAN7QIW9_9COLE|nr:hypothetical protein RN001_008274 [Aquatica leii]